jgi:hypothetical protein
VTWYLEKYTINCAKRESLEVLDWFVRDDCQTSDNNDEIGKTKDSGSLLQTKELLI